MCSILFLFIVLLTTHHCLISRLWHPVRPVISLCIHEIRDYQLRMMASPLTLKILDNIWGHSMWSHQGRGATGIYGLEASCAVYCPTLHKNATRSPSKNHLVQMAGLLRLRNPS